MRRLLRAAGVLADAGAWVLDGRVLACAYPRREAALAALAGQGITLLVNLHQRAHRPERLAQHAMTELHLPVRDFTAPSAEQIEQAVAALGQAQAERRRVAVHCGGGLGRTGTVLACYLVAQGRTAEAAIAEIRRVRPGSVETAGQVAAVQAYAAAQSGALGGSASPSPSA
ncbi:MAG: dual specificity protein phosphatase family protein [Chloroflexi bacterium]|nr:dual specificity protein phosphatase family protein [Chloroflexota bacterium]